MEASWTTREVPQPQEVSTQHERRQSHGGISTAHEAAQAQKGCKGMCTAVLFGTITMAWQASYHHGKHHAPTHPLFFGTITITITMAPSPWHHHHGKHHAPTHPLFPHWQTQRITGTP